MDCAECGRAGFSSGSDLISGYFRSCFCLSMISRERDSAVPTGSICQIREIKTKRRGTDRDLAPSDNI